GRRPPGSRARARALDRERRSDSMKAPLTRVERLRLSDPGAVGSLMGVPLPQQVRANYEQALRRARRLDAADAVRAASRELRAQRAAEALERALGDRP